MSLSGVHIGPAPLPATGEGEPVELTLGVEGRLRLSRRPLSAEDVAGGLLSSERVLTRAARVELHSAASAPLRVRVTENIPLSEADEVKVTLDAARTSAGYSLDAARGFVTWEVEVKPRAARALDLVYRVDVPDSWRLR